MKNKQDVKETPEYKKIFERDVRIQLEIANICNENMKIRQEIIDDC